MENNQQLPPRQTRQNPLPQQVTEEQKKEAPQATPAVLPAKAPKAPKAKGKFHLPKFPFPKVLKSKKVLVASVCAVAAAAVGAFFMFKPATPQTPYDAALKNVAEARYYMKSAQTQNLDVQFYSGIREEQYSRNGIATKCVPFAVVNVTGNDSLKSYDQITGEIKIGNEQYPITLLQNPYNPLNFTYDIVNSLNRNITCDDEVEVTLFLTSTNHPVIELADAFDENAITWDGALRVATEKLADKLVGKKFESYVTIIDNVAKEAGAFWYVQFITDKGETHYCVVAPDGSAIA